MNHTRLLELDALRGIAALVVVIHHYVFRYDELFGHPDSMPVAWAELGRYGVELFFMISGFVIFWTLNRVHRPMDFVVSRFSRLYPVYWCSVLATFMVVSLCGLDSREVDALEALGNLLMFHSYLKINHVDGVYWTLTVELTFYLWIFLYYLKYSTRNIEWVFAAFIALSAAHYAEAIYIGSDVRQAFILKYLPFFLIGICIFKLTHQSEGKRVSVALMVYSLLTTAIIFSPGLALLFSALALLFYLAAAGKLPFLAGRPLVFLGSISYSLYLIHQNIGYVIINYSYSIGNSPITSIALAVACALILATLMTRYIEQPAMRFIRRRYRTARS